MFNYLYVISEEFFQDCRGTWMRLEQPRATKGLRAFSRCLQTAGLAVFLWAGCVIYVNLLLDISKMLRYTTFKNNIKNQKQIEFP